MTVRPVLGIDIGGSGIKGAPVDLEVGDFAVDRLRIPTPKKSTPKKVGAAVAEIVAYFAELTGDGPIGITIPAVVTHGVTRTAANIDPAWIGFEAEKMFEDLLGRPVVVFNDADAAGLAEAHFGAAKDHPGLVLVTTLGTGIGTALVHRGVLIPNSEFGHIEIDGHDAETQASSGVKDRLGLSYKQWAPRVERYFQTVEALLWPDLIVVGGGISRDADKFLPRLNLSTPIVPAELRNRAGIIGAAWMAVYREDHPNQELRVEEATERALRQAEEWATAPHPDANDTSDQVLATDEDAAVGIGLELSGADPGGESVGQDGDHVDEQRGDEQRELQSGAEE